MKNVPHGIRRLMAMILMVIVSCTACSVEDTSSGNGTLSQPPPADHRPLTYGINRGIRDVLVCPESRPCPPGDKGDSVRNPQAPMPDVEIDILHGGKFGVARRLTNGSTLTSGEPFTVFLYARRPAYVYLIHHSSNGAALTELVSASALLGPAPCTTGNLLEPGHLLQLPASGSYYVLDDIPGTEVFYVVISKRPFCKKSDETRIDMFSSLLGFVSGKTQVTCTHPLDVCGQKIVFNHVSKTP
uniref:DUF4384 domain-containing protein n=1 Tax=Candidatus Kentrum sp. DK TaxID=2126562 RepID=A0A450T1Q3_9GAMM|nr:MAG: protein of unknown function (DUF4384) [Candidatus Kentron sp. DK]VFJ61305.1 MAG: protein of unknown function (DUF4384) [Candidatus Kentron sp. DK]